MPDLTDVNIKDLLKLDDADLRAALEAMLPKLTYPEHMLGLWAQHPEYGRVLVVSDGVFDDGSVPILYAGSDGTNPEYVPVSELTFPYQATSPEDVPVGEAWLVNVDDGKYSGERVVALKERFSIWRTAFDAVDDEMAWIDHDVTLIAPLTPQPSLSPEFVETEEEYEALPNGSIVADGMGFPLIKRDMETWYEPGSTRAYSNSNMSYSRRRVYRRGWGNE